MNPLIIVAGPTAVGKTDFSIWLAQKLNAEIVSADSMQVYKQMDIGTAKPSLVQQQTIKHHLIDLVEPDQSFSVADYQTRFHQTVADLNERGKTALVVGGTGLYIRACTQAYVFDEPAVADWELRNQLKTEAETLGNQILHQRLAIIDPQAATQIHPNDIRRVIRALEVHQITGVPISEQQQKRDSAAKYDNIYIYLERERTNLYQRIEQRVDLMIQEGLIDEVQRLRAQGYTSDIKPMQSLGYLQINQYLEDQITLKQAVDNIKQKTRNYAKRQLTWFRKEPVDYAINISGNNQEYYSKILDYIEGRIEEASNNTF